MVQLLKPPGTVVVTWHTEQSPVTGMWLALAVLTMLAIPGKFLPAVWQLAQVVDTFV